VLKQHSNQTPHIFAIAIEYTTAVKYGRRKWESI